MNYISTNGTGEPVSFKEAVLKGLADDGGLYVPERMPHLKASFWKGIRGMSLPEIGFEITRHFWEETGEQELRSLLRDALDFEVPLVQLRDRIYVLELFNGPTLAFKDFGARFMARVFPLIKEDTQQDIVILAATSGDTGSAVAQGFLGVEGIQVCLLYPSGKVSRIQEQQLTTAGQNVTALEVDGTFDDCQDMVKQAFSDRDLSSKLILSSANSINIARLIPQTFYYAHAFSQLEGDEKPVFSVPSGNFGNLTAGLWAQAMGLPAHGFIAATNVNDIFPEFLQTGDFTPRSSIQTISNAMDVGNPSNFDRIIHLYDHSLDEVKKHLWGASFSDVQTKQAIREVYDTSGYVMDPHTAVGYLGVKKYRESDNVPFSNDIDFPFIILSTAHPAKFPEEIEELLQQKIPLTESLKACMEKEKNSVPMPADYQTLKTYLTGQYS